MGIKNLSALLKKYAPNAVQQIPVANLEPGYYALDVSGYLFASQYNGSSKGKNNHIMDFLNLIHLAGRAGIHFVFIFDGNTKSEAKQHTTDERADKVSRTKQRIAELIGEPDDSSASSAELKQRGVTQLPQLTGEARVEMEMILKNFIVIRPECYTDLRTLFEKIGAPYFQAKGEADFLCASLYRAQMIKGVFSEDMDMLTHGVGRLVRGVMSATFYRDGLLTVCELDQVLQGLDLSMPQFRDVCILSGCDYGPKLEGVASVRGLTLVKKYGNMAGIISSGKFSIPDAFQADYERTYGIFSTEQETIPVEITASTACPTLLPWLIEKTGLSETRLRALVYV